MLPILPTVSILRCHQQRGGESYGFDNRLAAYDLAPIPFDTSALCVNPTSWRPTACDFIGPPRTPTVRIPAVEYASWAVMDAVGREDPYRVGRIGLLR